MFQRFAKRRRGDRPFRGPTFEKTISDRIVRKPGSRGHFATGQPFSVDLVANRRALVVFLLSASCPARITWFVVPEWIDSIKRVSGRARAKILQEGPKRLEPVGTHSDSGSAVIRIGRVCWIAASALHRDPGAVLTRPMCAMRFYGHTFTASAVRWEASSYRDRHGRSAVASAFPLSLEPARGDGHSAVTKTGISACEVH